MNTISLNLNFAGAVLPVVDCEDGHQRVPFKPLVECIGLEWARQHKKMQTPYFARRMGTCVEQMYYAGQSREMVLIRVDRVAAYLNTINPESVRAAGNESAADFLEQKHAEWDDLIHAYELKSGKGLFNSRAVHMVAAIARIDRIRNPELKKLAMAELGIDVPTAPAPTGNGQGSLFGTNG